MGAEFIFSVISTLSSLLSSLRSSGATSADGQGDGIERDLDRLERLLKRIQAALRDAGEREIRDEYVKLWLKELKTVAYEAEDILDECQYELLRCQIEDSGEDSSSSTDGKKRKRLNGIVSDEMAERIKSVIERFDEISRDKDALDLKEDNGERRGSVWTGLSPSSHLVNELAIFGRGKDKQMIIDFVLSDNLGRINPISAMAIVGMGGVGKTTLAQLVYNDSNVENHFNLRAWVYVSPEFDVRRITKEILESLSPGNICGALTGLSAIQKALVEAVDKKKVFIVLDDVWNESCSKWEQFLEPLRAAEFVKIVMTTRNDAVAQNCGITDTHNLSCLSENQSGLLFKHYVYGGQFIDEYSCLKEIGLQIIKKCAGLPLAIKSIGRVLCYKMDEDSWKHILESELWESDGKDEIFPALKVSYYSLPSALKPCFLFCSLFPKGSVLEMNQIIYMWIAHGYIQPFSGKRVEDIGSEFVHELCRRSFLTKEDTLQGGGLKYFKLHDLIHDLARSISTGEFYTINWDSINDVYTTAYHIYTENYGMFDSSSHRCSLKRTLIANVMKRRLNYANNHYNSNLMGRYNCKMPLYKNLRVLKWKGNLAHDDLVDIANLKHLRFFELDKIDLGQQKERPFESITLLFNLVALQLSNIENLKELPIHIGKLINLRFLGICQLGIRDLPKSFDQLSNLQYLSLSFCKHLQKLPTIIGNLTSLKQLYISNLNIWELPESLCMLQNLQILSVNRCWNMTQLPNGIGNLTNLQQMYCRDSCIETLPESMNKLCNLKILELGCTGSPVDLLCGFEGLLNRSSLNFFIKYRDFSMHPAPLMKTRGMVIKMEDNCMYVKSQSLLESLQYVNGLVQLELDGYQGIGYAFSKSCSLSAAIAMHCHVKSGNLVTELGELPSMKSLSLVNFSDWSISVGKRDGNFPVLEFLKIENCPKLSSVLNFGNIRRLDIVRCSFSKLELDLLHLQLLDNLFIGECIELTVLQGLQSLNSLRALCVFRCPLLREFKYKKIPNSTLSVEIVECPSLKDWSQIQQFKYIEYNSGTVNTSNWNQTVLIEHPGIQNYIKLGQCLYSLTILEISSCWKIGNVDWLKKLKSLRSFVLWDCPLLQLESSSNSNEIPLLPSLRSLTFHRCQHMLSLNLRVEDGSSLIKLEITDCKRLKYITGLQELANLESLVLVQCPQLILQPLAIVPNRMVISSCRSLKGWCKWHSVEPLDDELKLST